MHLNPLTAAKNSLSWKEGKHKAATDRMNSWGLRPKTVGKIKGRVQLFGGKWQRVQRKAKHHLCPGIEMEQYEPELSLPNLAHLSHLYWCYEG